MRELQSPVILKNGGSAGDDADPLTGEFGLDLSAVIVCWLCWVRGLSGPLVA